MIYVGSHSLCVIDKGNSIHSGTTQGDVKINFGRSERDAYLKHVVPIFSRFLLKCYST